MAAITATAEVDRYDEATDWFRRRTVITAAAARELDAQLKTEAFWIGGGLQLSQIQRVFDEIAVAQEKGEPFEQWRKRVRGELRDDFHAETVFRNATQRALNAGRWQQMTEPSVLQFRPFWLVDAVLDARTTDYCRSVDGTLLPADDPWWLVHYFPAHHRCRTGVRNLRRSESLKRGLKQPPIDQHPAPGFGAAPTGGSFWKPDPAKHEPALVRELERKAETGTKRRAPRSPKEHTPSHWLPRYRKRYGDAAPALARGKASLERGLDMTPERALGLLEQLDVPGADRMREGVRGLIEGRDIAGATLRELGGEIEPMAQAAAAVAGHLDSLPKRRPKIRLTGAGSKDPAAQRASAFYRELSHPKLKQPTDWTFARISERSSCSESLKRLQHWPAIGELEHEWGHALEALNPELGNKAKAFLRARTRGLKLERLSEALRDRRYRPDEVAWRDDFAHIYIGKRYLNAAGGFRATEITSMGVEMLAAGTRSHLNLAELMAQDPEHMLFVLGLLAGA